MRRLSVICFCLFLALANSNAQTKSDTSKVAGKSGLMFYFNFGASFSTGGYVPQTAEENEIAVNGLPAGGIGTGYYRTGVSHATGGCYGIGLEYLPFSKTRFFTVIDFGVTGYGFGGNVYDDVYGYQLGNHTNSIISNSIEANPYNYSYGMGGVSVYQFYRFFKKGNMRLSAGFGARMAYIFYEKDPAYVNGEESTPSTFGIFLSTRLRLKGKFTSLDLFADWGSGNDFANTFASTGIQFAFKLAP
jgi:hypothetical protein